MIGIGAMTMPNGFSWLALLTWKRAKPGWRMSSVQEMATEHLYPIPLYSDKLSLTIRRVPLHWTSPTEPIVLFHTYELHHYTLLPLVPLSKFTIDGCWIGPALPGITKIYPYRDLSLLPSPIIPLYTVTNCGPKLEGHDPKQLADQDCTSEGNVSGPLPSDIEKWVRLTKSIWGLIQGAGIRCIESWLPCWGQLMTLLSPQNPIFKKSPLIITTEDAYVSRVNDYVNA